MAALSAWSDHGRHGVIQAVTGTVKSRVGIEAVREALAHDFSVVVAVPTVDLVDQWVRGLRENGVTNVGTLADGQKATFRTHSVVVGTVQSLDFWLLRNVPMARCCSSLMNATAMARASGGVSFTRPTGADSA